MSRRFAVSCVLLLPLIAGGAQCAYIFCFSQVYATGANEEGQLGLGDVKGRCLPSLLEWCRVEPRRRKRPPGMGDSGRPRLRTGVGFRHHLASICECHGDLLTDCYWMCRICRNTRRRGRRTGLHWGEWGGGEHDVAVSEGHLGW